MTTSEQRNCYCKPGEVSCGTCERCGAPGHTRHFPGGVPYTGAWCDRCYRIVGLTHLAGTAGPVAIAVLLAMVLWRSCAP
jgi:hypothetical protein